MLEVKCKESYFLGFRQYKCRAPRLNVIQVLVQAISKRVQQERHDELIDHAWSSLWNLTDETEVNCERFIELGGVDMFLKCHQLFGDHQDMIRNMLGCLGNVAEVKALRQKLLTTECLNVFSQLLRPGRVSQELNFGKEVLVPQLHNAESLIVKRDKLHSLSFSVQFCQT